MSLKIPERFITDLKNFTWGKDWRATRIIKEKRSDGEYYYGNIVRYYGEKEDTHDYDIAESLADSAWIGRVQKFVGQRKFDDDQDSPTVGRRIYTEAVTEVVEEKDLKGKPVEREVLVKGKVIYEYNIPVNPKNTEKMRTLEGAIALNQETQLLMIYGTQPPHAVDPDTFWKTSVSDYLEFVKTIPKKDGKKV